MSGSVSDHYSSLPFASPSRANQQFCCLRFLRPPFVFLLGSRSEHLQRLLRVVSCLLKTPEPFFTSLTKLNHCPSIVRPDIMSITIRSTLPSHKDILFLFPLLLSTSSYHLILIFNYTIQLPNLRPLPFLLPTSCSL
jgi:hypothetical protein